MKNKRKSLSLGQIIAGFIIFIGVFNIWDQYTSGITISQSNYVMILGGTIFLLLRWKKSD